METFGSRFALNRYKYQKDSAGKLLVQHFLMCTTLEVYMCDNCAKKVMCCEL